MTFATTWDTIFQDRQWGGFFVGLGMTLYQLALVFAVVGVFIFPALACFAWRKGWLLRLAGLLLLAGWAAVAGWMGVVFGFPQWLDTPAERVLMARLLAAANQGRESVPLQELTDFDWRVVCIASGRQYPAGQDRRLIAEATGEDALPRLTPWLQETDEMLVFATPGRTRTMAPVWWRLNAGNQRLWRFRYLAPLTGGKAYDVELALAPAAPGQTAGWEPVCYLPAQVGVRIRAE